MKKIDNNESELAKRLAELIVSHKEKAELASQLMIANEELLFQNKEKEMRVAELAIANKEKAKRAAELMIANDELIIENKETFRYLSKVFLSKASIRRPS